MKFRTHHSSRKTIRVGISLAALILASGPALADDAPARSSQGAATEGQDGSPVQVPKVSVTDTAGQGLSATTDGTKSYATPAVTVSGKVPVEWKEVPNSVSVITRQEIEDRNMTTVAEALKAAPGVTVVPNDGIQSQYLSRGYAMGVTYDGIPSYSGTGASGFEQFDTVVYDRIEVLKGPSGLLQGSESPGGTVNLVRKRARDSFAYGGAQSIGSWNNYRTEADVTGPLNAEGTLRGRAAFAGQDRNFFYDHASSLKRTGYGTLEYDITPSTTVTTSLTYQHDRSSPYMGWPDYSNGTFIKSSRSFNPTPAWAKYTNNIQEESAGLEQKFSNGWVAKVASTWREQYFHFKDGYVNSAVNIKNDTVGYTVRDKIYEYYWSNQDAYLTGPIQIFGQTHTLLAGVNSTTYNYDWVGSSNVTAVSSSVGTLLYNPSAAVTTEPTLAYTQGGKSRTQQYGGYGQFRLQLLDPLAVVAGGRLSNFSARTKSVPPSTPSNWAQGAKVTKEFTPYTGVIYDLTKEISLYSSYAEIFIPQTSLQANGQMLPPRLGDQYEVGTKGAFLGGKLNTSLAAFYIEDTNRAYVDPANPNYYLPAGKGETQGWEAEVTGNPLPNLDLTAGYTFLITKLVTASSGQGTTISSFTPKHSFKIWGNYHFTNGLAKDFSVGTGVDASSLTHGTGVETTMHQNAYAIVGAQIGYQFREDLSATFTANNIFDTTYYTRIQGSNTYNIIGEPRNFMLTLRKSL